MLAVDEPRDLLLVPVSWQKTARNLQAAIDSSIAGGEIFLKEFGFLKR